MIGNVDQPLGSVEDSEFREIHMVQVQTRVSMFSLDTDINEIRLATRIGSADRIWKITSASGTLLNSLFFLEDNFGIFFFRFWTNALSFFSSHLEVHAGTPLPPCHCEFFHLSSYLITVVTHALVQVTSGHQTTLTDQLIYP